MGAGDQRDQLASAAIVRSPDRSTWCDVLKVSNLEICERVVNLKLKNFLLDFCRASGLQRSIGDGARDRVDIRRRRSIVGERRHDRTHTRVYTCERR
jgi:hypothetical protein